MSDRVVREIKRRMETLGLNVLATAKKAKLGDDAVRDIIRGKSANPSHSTLSKIAKALGCTVGDLTGEKAIAPRAPDAVVINELDVHIAAGLGSDAEASIMTAEETGAVIGTYSFPATGFREVYGASPDAVRIIPVRGDSMVPTLFPGQRVMVDTTDRKPSPPGVFVVWDGLGLVLKRLELILGSEPARVRLSSDNTRYQAYERTLDEAYINGRVIGVWARM